MKINKVLIQILLFHFIGELKLTPKYNFFTCRTHNIVNHPILYCIVLIIPNKQIINGLKYGLSLATNLIHSHPKVYNAALH